MMHDHYMILMTCTGAFLSTILDQEKIKIIDSYTYGGYLALLPAYSIWGVGLYGGEDRGG